MECTIGELVGLVPVWTRAYRDKMRRLPGSSDFKTAIRFFEFISGEVRTSSISDDTWLVVYHMNNVTPIEGGWYETFNCDLFFRNASCRNNEAGAIKITYYQRNSSNVKAKAIYDFAGIGKGETCFTTESNIGEYCDDEVTWAERMMLDCLKYVIDDNPRCFPYDPS